MTIKQVTRANLGVVQQEFVKELKAVADRLGLDISNGGGTYSNGGTGTVKIDISVKDDGTGVSGAAAEFAMYARTSGIDPDAFGKDFVFDARKPWDTYKVSGVNPGSPKYRFSATRNSDGKTFKFTPDALRKHFPAKAVAA
ncbi:hypothetical protein PXK56_18245 [Phaeobacter gallaeciensis]|uniref:hypothetical protein n=1 Tax=Phaeobacter gallaeciensis TaxID=60890 RepID=UPI0023800B0E|nr:hypothetical protein [Phaeobacter gallaeciensis]MDE4297128.1 hypothetical protein [Phaeobacter gallaeciensis]